MSKQQISNTSSQQQSRYRLAESLRCPSCNCADLECTDNHITCKQCDDQYPFIGHGKEKYPFLLADSGAAWQGWYARLDAFNQKVNEEIASLQKKLSDKKNSQLTSKRIKKLIHMNQAYQKQVNGLLPEFSGGDLDPAANTCQSVAKNQSVDSYINNIFRDWCWNNGENEENLAALNSVIIDDDFTANRVLALGAGASRLVVDFQHEYDVEHCVLLDINPFLLKIASNIIHGNKIDLAEFPTAPISFDDYAVMHTDIALADDHVTDSDKFEFILADASNIPFQDKAFDTILTPWLIDILPINFRDFIPHINRLLPVGGCWLNTGSLAFFNQDQAINYSQEEVIDLLKKYGFEVIAWNRKKINYLQSPYSAHGRIENVFNFCACKKYDCVPADTFNYLPEWIMNTTITIPSNERLLVSSSRHLLQAQVLAAIDGKRSSNDIAVLIAREYDMPIQSAELAVRQILMQNYS